MNKKTFEVDIDGKSVKMAVLRPSAKVNADAQLVYNRAFREAVEAGSLIEAKLDKVAREQRVWDDEKQARFEEIVSTLQEGEYTLSAGKKSKVKKLSDARSIALGMKRLRQEMQDLLEVRNTLRGNTAESFAEQARFDYLVSVCTVYNDSGKPYYRDLEDFLDRDTKTDPVGRRANEAMGLLWYNLEEDFDKKLPENKFLIEKGLMNQSMRLIRKTDGKFVDEHNRLVDERGRLINEAGELIDFEGKPLTEDGDYKVEFEEFEDDLSSAEPSKTEDNLVA